MAFGALTRVLAGVLYVPGPGDPREDPGVSVGRGVLEEREECERLGWRGRHCEGRDTKVRYHLHHILVLIIVFCAAFVLLPFIAFLNGASLLRRYLIPRRVDRPTRPWVIPVGLKTTTRMALSASVIKRRWGQPLLRLDLVENTPQALPRLVACPSLSASTLLLGIHYTSRPPPRIPVHYQSGAEDLYPLLPRYRRCIEWWWRPLRIAGRIRIPG